MARPTLRARITDPSRPGSLAARARGRRWERFEGLFPDLSDMTVIDLGGTVDFWASIPVRPAELILVNPAAVPDPRVTWAEVVAGDACELPERIASRRFDLVYSNSTIEHVGGHLRRQRFADVVRKLAPHLWVQTPYRYFPLEPHFVFPLFQHLPVAARTSLVAHWPLRPPDFPTEKSRIRDEVMSIHLLSVAEMEAYFPDTEIQYERAGGLIKSLIAVG